MSKIPGVIIAMGGQDWTIPPLTLGQLRRLMPKVRELTDVGANMGEEQIGTLVEIVTAAMLRNYPDITLEQVEELLDLGNARDVMTAVLTGSGLKPAGEAMATARLDGATSTGSSLPLSDSESPTSTL